MVLRAEKGRKAAPPTTLEKNFEKESPGNQRTSASATRQKGGKKDKSPQAVKKAARIYTTYGES